VPAAFTLGVWLLATPAADPEPGLLETQEAAARAAGGSPGQDASRLQRARAAHWAPQLRGQATARDDEKTRNGEYRLAPLHEQNVAVGHAWMLTLTWDLSQVIFAREETQLALAHLQQLRRQPFGGRIVLQRVRRLGHRKQHRAQENVPEVLLARVLGLGLLDPG